MTRKNYREVYRKGRIIQSWKALNLYNLHTYQPPFLIQKTFYQQKWLAKSHTRTYHGRQVREKQWQLMFNRRLPAVVDMNINRLASDDGSRQASGRGSGRDSDKRRVDRYGKAVRERATPYTGMTFWPLERRLDTAIHRALFASSVRTARQFVVHGHVKVNGKKIKYPGYLLNPGDMFSVDPELVMLSTGMPNSGSTRKYVYKNPPPDAPADFESAKNEQARFEERKKLKERGEVQVKSSLPAESTSDAATPASTEASAEAPEASAGDDATPAPSANKLKADLQRIEAQIKAYLRPSTGRGYVFRTRKQTRLFKLRTLRKEVKEAIAAVSSGQSSPDTSTLTNKAKRLAIPTNPIKTHLQKASPSSPIPTNHLDLLKTWPNAQLQDKPYVTPWLPRNFMSAFAFIPRYLEVNQNVCSAVYLRHPVARKGESEVPSPFTGEMGLLAYQWYLRRR